jgi:hypothetical protein
MWRVRLRLSDTSEVNGIHQRRARMQRIHKAGGGEMNACLLSRIAALASVATFLIEPSAIIMQAAARLSPESAFAGTWEGKMNDLPGIELKMEVMGGKVTGTIVFYYQERSDPNGPWHVAGENPVPLLMLHVVGKTLTFEVQHHKCHGCAELGPNVKFRMELTGQNEARLWNLENQEAKKDLGPGLKLVRRTEPASTGN